VISGLSVSSSARRGPDAVLVVEPRLVVGEDLRDVLPNPPSGLACLSPRKPPSPRPGLQLPPPGPNPRGLPGHALTPRETNRLIAMIRSGVDKLADDAELDDNKARLTSRRG
jgi:hypothetical protein